MGDVAVLPSSSHRGDVFVATAGKDHSRTSEDSNLSQVPQTYSFSNSSSNASNLSSTPSSSSPPHNDSDSSLNSTPGSPAPALHPSRVSKIRTIGNYCIERTIGRGQFGKVKLAYHKKVPDLKVAIKIINKTRLDDDTLRMIQREVRIMKLMNHPHIIKLYEVIETSKMFFLIMEYAEGGEVMDFIIAHGKIPEREARRFFVQMLSAVEYCHSKRCVHRDLKPENLLLDSNMNVKIIDFGLSNVYTPGSLLKTFCGSPTYASPELILRKEYFGPAVDVWSMGVVLYVLVCGYLPFDGHNFNELFHKILKVQYTIPSHVSEECASLIRRMLVVDPAQRVTIEELRRCSWLGTLSGYLHSTIPDDIDDISKVDKGTMLEMETNGYNTEEVTQSLLSNRYDDAAAMYFLLESKRKRKNSLASQEQSKQSPRSAKETEGKEPIPAPLPTVPIPRFQRGHRRNNTVDTCSSPEESPKHAHLKERDPHHAKEKAKVQEGGATRSPLRTTDVISPRSHRRAASEAMKEEMLKQAKEKHEGLANKEGDTLDPSKSQTANNNVANKGGDHQIVEDGWVLMNTNSGNSTTSDYLKRSPSSEEEDNNMGRSPSRSTVSSLISSLKSMWKHKPSSPQQPRVVRFAFTLNTTSDKSVEDIIKEVTRVLKEMDIDCTMKSSFVMDCVVDNVRFSVEVCRLPRLLMSGIRLSRISGSAWKYKTIAKELVAHLKL